jgi:hypothetical protein
MYNFNWRRIDIIGLCYDTCNAMWIPVYRLHYVIINASYNQRQRFFLFQSWTMDVVITVEKVRAPNAGRTSGAPHLYWPHIWWLNQAVTRGVDCNERWLYAVLIINCVDCSGAESIIGLCNSCDYMHLFLWKAPLVHLRSLKHFKLMVP